MPRGRSSPLDRVKKRGMDAFRSTQPCRRKRCGRNAPRASPAISLATPTRRCGRFRRMPRDNLRGYYWQTALPPAARLRERACRMDQIAVRHRRARLSTTSGVVQKIDPDGGPNGSGRRDGIDRRVRRRGAIGNRDALETVARQRGSDAGGETTGGSRHERAAIFNASYPRTNVQLRLNGAPDPMVPKTRTVCGPRCKRHGDTTENAAGPV